ncbi:MAG: hypothetical protein HYU51_09615 [Candidatus Rokubacteria bacterium]|nr:hypothetical protein [Candidatus Rokubacteria bacterium]
MESNIRAGFLRAHRSGRRRYVTLQACIESLLEEQYDLAMVERAPRGRGIPWEEVERELDALPDDLPERRESPRMPSLAERHAVIRDLLRPLARSMPGAAFGALLTRVARLQARKHLRAERLSRRLERTRDTRR